MRILLAPVSVQGAGAAQTIIGGINLLNEIDEVDVIIVGRGGGSYEDLSCFNDEQLARAVFASKKPIISAVGHEIDFTIADFAADLRAPTPSAAAELCVPELDALRSGIAESLDRIASAAVAQLNNAKQRIKLLSSDSVLSKPSTMLDMKREKLNAAKNLLEQKTAEGITAAYLRLEGLEKRLDALSPFAVLKRGYAIVTDQNGETVYNASELSDGSHIGLRFSDGTVAATVDKSNEKGS